MHNPMHYMRHMHHKKHKHEKLVLVASIAALALLLCRHTHQLMGLVQKRRKHKLQDKIDHFQNCFERLLEHS